MPSSRTRGRSRRSVAGRRWRLARGGVACVCRVLKNAAGVAQLIMREQDTQLEEVGQTIGVLKDMGRAIGDELEDQNMCARPAQPASQPARPPEGPGAPAAATGLGVS